MDRKEYEKEYYKFKELKDKNFWDIVGFIFSIFQFIIWHAVIPAFAGLGCLFYTARSGNTAYLLSFVIAIALSNMIQIWNKNEYARKGLKRYNRIQKRNKEISKIRKRKNARRN